MSTKDSSKTGDKSQTQLDIEKKLEEDLVFGNNPLLGGCASEGKGGGFTDPKNFETPEEDDDFHFVPPVDPEKVRRYKMVEIKHDGESEKLDGSNIRAAKYTDELGDLVKQAAERRVKDMKAWGVPLVHPSKHRDPGEKAKEGIRNMFEEEIEKELGVKKSNHKPQVGLLDIQFPKALRAVSQASMAGHEKYKETDQDYKNFKRVPNAEMQYRHASRRHELDREDDYIDPDTGVPHIVLKAWNVLAELEIHLENKKLNKS